MQGIYIYLVISVMILSHGICVGRANASKSRLADIFNLQCHERSEKRFEKASKNKKKSRSKKSLFRIFYTYIQQKISDFRKDLLERTAFVITVV